MQVYANVPVQQYMSDSHDNLMDESQLFCKLEQVIVNQQLELTINAFTVVVCLLQRKN